MLLKKYKFITKKLVLNLSKIVLFELFEADITIKDSSGFIVNSIKPVEDTKIISLYVDNTEVSSGFYFSFNKKYTIPIGTKR